MDVLARAMIMDAERKLDTLTKLNADAYSNLKEKTEKLGKKEIPVGVDERRKEKGETGRQGEGESLGKRGGGDGLRLRDSFAGNKKLEEMGIEGWEAGKDEL